MKESVLRETIRKEIRKSLKEQDVTTGVERETGRIEKNAGVKMLKRALAQGSPRQQAAGLVKVINAISGGSTAVKNALVQMLKRTDIGAPEAPEAPDVSVTEAEVNPALVRKADRLDKTQAMKMLKQTLGSKAATQQTDFVLDLINNLGLKDAAKQRLKMKIRKSLK
mgnify:CR=1 FL=1